MSSGGDQVAFLRTLIAGDFATNDDIEARLDAAGWPGWTMFLANCFYSAVDGHFGRPLNRSEVIRFVADLRDWAGPGEPDIDPVLCELLISSVLDGSVDVDGAAIDQEMSGLVQIAVVHRILAMPGFDIDTFLDDNRRRTFSASLSECPACGAGAEQSTDPENLARSVCYCGHPRYYDERHRDGTCPCLVA